MLEPFQRAIKSTDTHGSGMLKMYAQMDTKLIFSIVEDVN